MIVLVHGAFASPAGWDGVAEALHKDGYQTATPTLGLTSVADDVAIVRSTLDSIPVDKILVGHSYGGFVITNAASGRTDVRGLIYTRRTSQTAVRRSQPERWLHAGGVPGPSGARPGVPLLRRRPAVLPRGLRPGLEPEAGRRDRRPTAPNELGLFVTPSGAAEWHTLPLWYAVSAHDRVIDPALLRFMAQRAGSTTVEFSAASYVSGLTHYTARFVKLIERTSERRDRKLIPAVDIHECIEVCVGGDRRRVPTRLTKGRRSRLSSSIEPTPPRRRRAT
jgi:pimeloyl-ACP methyl ester carboxylesterase